MKVDCPMCEGQGLVFDSEQKPQVCPHCKGSKTVEVPPDNFIDLETGDEKHG